MVGQQTTKQWTSSKDACNGRDVAGIAGHLVVYRSGAKDAEACYEQRRATGSHSPQRRRGDM